MRSVTWHHACHAGTVTWVSSQVPLVLTCCRSRVHLFVLECGKRKGECGKTFQHLGCNHLWMMWKGLGPLVCDTMSMCSPSRGLTTGFQASLQHLENNLRGHPRVGSNPRPRVSCLVLYPLGHCDEIKVHAWTIPDISLSHRSAIIADWTQRFSSIL